MKRKNREKICVMKVDHKAEALSFLNSSREITPEFKDWLIEEFKESFFEMLSQNDDIDEDKMKKIIIAEESLWVEGLSDFGIIGKLIYKDHWVTYEEHGGIFVFSLKTPVTVTGSDGVEQINDYGIAYYGSSVFDDGSPVKFTYTPISEEQALRKIEDMLILLENHDWPLY